MSAEIERVGWQRFDHDPRLPAHQHLRAADRDRDAAGQLLADAFAEGRLDREELDERQDATRAARTLGELVPLVSDLVSDAAPAARPVSMRAEAEAQYRQRRAAALSTFLVPTLICWVVWLSVSGVGSFPWPLIVTIATVAPLVRIVAGGREEQVLQIQRELEEKQRRREQRRQRRLGGPGA